MTSLETSTVDGQGRWPRVFIGSSSEGKEIARQLAVDLENAVNCEVTTWFQGAFGASDYALDSLSDAAGAADFAVLVTTPDDKSLSRGAEEASPRDNVIFELGLFIGALGRGRTYIVRVGGPDEGLKLPSDLAGLTWLPYRRRVGAENHSAALNEAVLGITAKIRMLKPRDRQEPRTLQVAAAERVHAGNPGPMHTALRRELDQVCADAAAQGWKVKTRSETTLRLVSPKGVKRTLSIDDEPREARIQLRRFVNDLRSMGLRVNQSVRRRV